MHPPRSKGLIAGLIKGNTWLISPDHKALFLGGFVRGGRLTSDDVAVADVLFLRLCQFFEKKIRKVFPKLGPRNLVWVKYTEILSFVSSK